MAIEYGQVGAVAIIDDRVTGDPAVRITAADVRLTIGANGRVLATSANSPALEIDAPGAVIVNAQNGQILSFRQFGDPVIRGSSGNDVVENSGRIDGRVDMGDGADAVIVHYISGTYDLGAGDDLYRVDTVQGGANDVQGGAGFDRFVIGGGAYGADGLYVHGFEQLEVEAGTSASINRFTGLGSFVVGSGARLTTFDGANPSASVIMQGGGELNVGTEASVGLITGTDAVQQITVAASGAITDAVDLKGGDDIFTLVGPGALWNATVMPSVSGRVDGGAGRDTLAITADGRHTVDLANYVGFEVLTLQAGTLDGVPKSSLRLTNVTSIAEIQVGGLVNDLTLAQTDLSNLLVGMNRGGTFTLEAGSVIGAFGFPSSSFPYQDTQGDTRLSERVINAGRIAGDVTFVNGDDLYEGALGSVGGLVFGAAGNDDLHGGAGSERFDGGSGNDRLAGGLGADSLTGGTGADSFIGSRAELAGDTITDFSNDDRIVIADAEYSSFGFVRVGGNVAIGIDQSITLATNPAARLVIMDDASGNATLALAGHMTGLSDFGGDGHSDLLWRNANGGVSTWSIGGNVRGDQVQQNSFYAQVDTKWRVAETFDLDGDSRSDILWRHSDGALSVWSGSANGFIQNSYYDGSVGTDWQIAAAGDINGDGKDDLLWRQASGAISIWTSTGTGFAKNSFYDASVANSWHIIGLTDVNGDGRADVLWRDNGGAISTWTSTSTGFVKNSFYDASVNRTWYIAGLGDINGDGRDDIIWRNDNGSVSTWEATGAGYTKNVYSASVDPQWSIAQVGDFNDDGKVDLLWRNSAGDVSSWQSDGHGFVQNVTYNSVGSAWDIQAHNFTFG